MDNKRLVLGAILTGAFAVVIVGFMVATGQFANFFQRILPAADTVPTALQEMPLAVATQTPEGAVWYEQKDLNSPVVMHEAIPDARIVGVARAGGRTFVIATDKTGESSTLYEYVTNSYKKLLSGNGAYSDLSVNADGTLASFSISIDENPPFFMVVDTLDGGIVIADQGFGATLLGYVDATSVLFLRGADVIVRTQTAKDTWSGEEKIYTDFVPFRASQSLGGDRKDLISFVDSTDTLQVWRMIGTGNTKGAPVNAYQLRTQKNKNLSFFQGTPISIMTDFVANTDTERVVSIVTVQVIALGNAGYVSFPLKDTVVATGAWNLSN